MLSNYKVNKLTVLPGMMVLGFVNVPTARHVCTELFNQILRSTVQFQVMCQPKVHTGFNGFVQYHRLLCLRVIDIKPFFLRPQKSFLAKIVFTLTNHSKLIKWFYSINQQKIWSYSHASILRLSNSLLILIKIILPG